MTALTIERLTDPVLSVLLPFLRDAVNADMAALMTANGLPVETAVETTLPHPVRIDMGISEDQMPVLSAYRYRQARKRRTFSKVENVITVQAVYVSPLCAHTQIADRWPLLEAVWSSIMSALSAGYHVAHSAGARVLDDAGMVEFNQDTATKTELFIERGEYAFPAFRGEFEVRWAEAAKPSTSVPLASVTAGAVVEGGDPTSPDVSTTIVYPSAFSNEPFGEEGAP